MTDDDRTPTTPRLVWSQPPETMNCRCVAIPLSRSERAKDWLSRWTVLNMLALALGLACVAAAIYQFSGSNGLWDSFARLHRCHIIERRGEWAKYFCNDGLTYSRRAE